MHDLIDLARYPIDGSDPARYAALLGDVRAQLADSGCCVLSQFFRAHVADALRDEARALAPHAHVNNIITNAYSTRDDPSLPDDHPVRLFMERTNAFVPSDHIPATSAVRRLYASAVFKRFVADCFEQPAVYEYADPLAGLVLNVLGGGCQHPWHYDANEFIVSALLQRAEGGGVFEYCPQIRSPADENYVQVSRVIRDVDRQPVRALSIAVGDIQLFRGRYSLHRVTRVHGDVPRIAAIFAYAKVPGFISTVERARQLFGRVTDAHVAAAATRRAHDGLID